MSNINSKKALTRNYVRGIIDLTKGGNIMKEMLKSKTILLFIVIMLGFILFSNPSTKLEDDKVNESYLSYNIK